MKKTLAVLLALAALLAGQTMVASAAAPEERLDELQETSYQDALGKDGMQSEIQITGYLVLDLPEETTQEQSAENPADTAAAPSPTPNSVSQDASSAVLAVEKLPKTGEQMETALYLAMILVLGSAVMILLCLLLRRDAPEEQERTAAPD